jgi:hypothetical protein
MKQKLSELWAKFKETKLYKGFEKLHNDLKPMTWRQRIDHLWTYYKETLIGVAILAITLSVLFTIMTSQAQETVVGGIVVNTSLHPDALAYMTDEYKEEIAPNDKNKLVKLEYTHFGDLMDVENGENSYYSSMILTARVSGGMLDYMILDKFAMEFYITQEVYLDLREFFTEEELAELDAQNKVIYAMQEGETERWPIAVDVSEMPFFKEYVTSEGETYFALSGFVRSLDTCRDVWNRLNNWKPAE